MSVWVSAGHCLSKPVVSAVRVHRLCCACSILELAMGERLPSTGEKWEDLRSDNVPRLEHLSPELNDILASMLKVCPCAAMTPPRTPWQPRTQPALLPPPPPPHTHTRTRLRNQLSLSVALQGGNAHGFALSSFE